MTSAIASTRASRDDGALEQLTSTTESRIGAMRRILAQRYRSATRVLGAGRASARNVTSIRVGCSVWLAPFFDNVIAVDIVESQDSVKRQRVGVSERYRVTDGAMCFRGIKIRHR